ncbi:MAG: sigma-70 family RNA polymerase sigma factor [Sedimentisphaerales bacterium]|nr:sigma-70 family RNA polymerase sigma factor [Sedimentisphaerales bacterium]
MENVKNLFSQGTGEHFMGQNPQMDQDKAASALTDELLVRRCRNGEMAAFAELIERHQHRLFNAVLRMVYNHDDAQELTQDAFVRALQGLSRFRGNSGFYTWLFRIGMNLCINFHRRRKTVRFSSLDALGQTTGHQADGLLELPDKQSPTPGRQAQINEEHQKVLKALEQLEPISRAVIVLRDVEELDYRQIADILEVPLGTVKSRLFRARLAVREQLE